MSERITQLEGYLSSIILGEFPDLNPSAEEPRHLGVRYRLLYDYDNAKKEMKLGLTPVLSEESPKWLGPVLNMCLTQIGFALDDNAPGFLMYFQQPMVNVEQQKMGDVYLHISLHDRTFMYHLPLGCAIHLLPKETLLALKRMRYHKFCREVIKELAAREMHTR